MILPLFFKILSPLNSPPPRPQNAREHKILQIIIKGSRHPEGQSFGFIFPIITHSLKWILEVALRWQTILLYGNYPIILRWDSLCSLWEQNRNTIGYSQYLQFSRKSLITTIKRNEVMIMLQYGWALKTLLSGKSQSEKRCILWLHIYETFWIRKSIDKKKSFDVCLGLRD